MKWLLSFIICISTAYSFASGWGALANYTYSAQEGRPDARPGERYLLGKIAAGRPLRVFVEVPPQSQAPYRQLLQESYQQWFSHAAQTIRRRGREKEFADVLPVLDRAVQIDFTDGNSPRDIDIFIWPIQDIARQCSGARGCYRFLDGENVPQMYLPLYKISTKLKTVFVHEIGHSLGLSDQYASARSSSHAVYSSAQSSKSVMYASASLTCDDADGLINLLDLTLGLQRGGAQGWRTLCRGKNTYYVQGKPIDKGPYSIRQSADLTYWLLEEVRDGKSRLHSFPFDLDGHYDPLASRAQTPLAKDSLGRTVLARGANGEQIYYSYNYDQKVRMVVQNGKVVAVETSGPIYTSRQTLRGQLISLSFGIDGQGQMWKMLLPAGARGKEGWVGQLYADPNKEQTWFEVDKDGHIGYAQNTIALTGKGRKKTAGQPRPKKQATDEAPGPQDLLQAFDSALQQQQQSLRLQLWQWYMSHLQ